MTNIMFYMARIDEQATAEAFKVMDEIDKEFGFFQFVDNCIKGQQDRGLVSKDIDIKDLQSLYIMAFSQGVSVEKERQKQPITDYIKENDHVFVEFENEELGMKQVVNVSKKHKNKDIKKIISQLIGKEYKGKFRKYSEFEHAKALKQFKNIGMVDE